ncbi:hypothetical protein IFM89_024810 [Coptis chinensis]|uniref:FAR1 domain-containing protein n=1 Tax=Coptis chinensis TaxID=261450 RepID=A0A835HRX0_9MAGN|nr:hypothetical protein IFM89_024810 [Coptis chinensis]
MEFEPLNIENELIEYDMGYEDDAVDIEHPVDDEEDDMIESSSVGREMYIPDGDTNLEPYEGMELESEEAAKAFYNSYARRVGFSTRVSKTRRSRKDGAIIQRSFVCAKEGFRVEKERPGVNENRIKRPRAVTRVGCKAMLAVKMQPSGRWVVSGFVKEHNHDLVPADKVHCLRSHRHVSGSAKSLIDTLQAADEGAKTIDVYNVAMESIQDALKRVALAKKNGGRLPMINGSSREDGLSEGGHQWALGPPQTMDEKEKKIQELSRDLSRANRKSELYRANLLTVLKDIEDQKLQLSVKVQNIKLGMKDRDLGG